MNVSILLVLAIFVIVLFFIRRKLKRINLPNVYLITGAVKSGKSALSVALAINKYRKNLFKWWITRPFQKFKKWFQKVFKKNPNYELPLKPMLYSNIPLNYYHNRLTFDIILRKKRIPENSVVLIDESSLLADSMMFKSDYINNALRLFFKLFAHAYGNDATCIINTQSFSDNHMSIKRCLGTYLYIYSKVKFPFFTLFKVRELLNQEETGLSISTGDVEADLLTMFMWNHTYKRYSSRCYSGLTDHLEYEVDYNKAKEKHELICNEVLDLHDLYNALMKYQKGVDKK